MTTNETCTTAPVITLAGREWPVPKLAPRQNRIVVPALVELIPKILAARDEAAAAGDSGSFAHLARYLDTASYDTLASLVFTALTRANPDLARNTFDDMAIDTFELIAAVRTIALQAGLLKAPTPPPPRSLSSGRPSAGPGGGTSPTLRAGEKT